jgi:hypothetical protein
MGPNCYLTPGRCQLQYIEIVFGLCLTIFILGGGYTQVHQDGHGTVDSGHSNLCGFNEVVMLRRLPECHKLQACQKIPTLANDISEEEAVNCLYKLPHDDGRVSQCNFAIFDHP